MNMDKPHKGKLDDWTQYPTPGKGLGWMAVGRFNGHPQFDGLDGHTSFIVAIEKQEDGTFEVETNNSRYTLLKPIGEISLDGGKTWE